MLATSWKATGKLRPLWNRLPVPIQRREELGRLAGIPAPNLSKMNTGRMPMTIEMASRIVDAMRDTIPEITVLDLGAPEEMADENGRVLFEEVAALRMEIQRREDEHAALQREFDSFVQATTARLADLEADPEKRARR